MTKTLTLEKQRKDKCYEWPGVVPVCFIVCHHLTVLLGTQQF